MSEEKTPTITNVMAWIKELSTGLSDEDARHLSVKILGAVDTDEVTAKTNFSGLVEALVDDEEPDNDLAVRKANKLIEKFKKTFTETMVPPALKVDQEPIPEKTAVVKEPKEPKEPKAKAAKKVVEKEPKPHVEKAVKPPKPPKIRKIVKETDEGLPTYVKPEPSQGLGWKQVTVLRELIKSTPESGTIDPLDVNSGGMVFDSNRHVFQSFLVRGGICKIVDAIIVTPKQRKRWSKKVLAEMPFALEVLNDYIKNHPDTASVLAID